MFIMVIGNFSKTFAPLKARIQLSHRQMAAFHKEDCKDTVMSVGSPVPIRFAIIAVAMARQSAERMPRAIGKRNSDQRRNECINHLFAARR